MDYTSQGQGTLNTVLGAVGTAGALGGGLLNMFTGNGGINNGNGGSSDDKLVSRYELSLIQENAILKAQADVDKKLLDVYNTINDKINTVVNDQMAINSAQAVTNCAVTSQLGVINNNLALLMGMTKTVIPNSSVCPGWGTATVTVGTTTTTA